MHLACGAAAATTVVQAAAKRYRVTGSGKVMVRRAGKQHLNEKQSRKTKRNLGWVVWWGARVGMLDWLRARFVAGA